MRLVLGSLGSKSIASLNVLVLCIDGLLSELLVGGGFVVPLIATSGGFATASSAAGSRFASVDAAGSSNWTVPLGSVVNGPFGFVVLGPVSFSLFHGSVLGD